MPDERTSRLIALAPQFGSLAVVLALVAVVIPAAKPTLPTVATVAPPPVEQPAEKSQTFDSFLNDADLLAKDGFTLKPDLKDVLIATLPDPVGTDFGYWFDQCVESIGRAMADGGNYGLERYWHAGTTAGTKPAAEQLGVLVYRRNDQPTDRRVVLIVHENALNGVQHGTFVRALSMLPSPGTERVVKILGPSFSGSLPSILESIKQWNDTQKADVRLISGSAIGIPSESTLPPGTNPGAKALLIRSTHSHIVLQMNAMLRYLTGPGETRPDAAFMTDPHSLDLSRVAFLIESNSAFGSAAVRAAASLGSPWVLRFPLHISKMTAILSSEQRRRDERLGLGGRNTLNSLDEARAKRDLVPAADELRTAELNKRLLDDYCEALNRERVRWIGVIATDPRDKLYLIDLFRRECPNARFFTHGADNHFVHPSYFAPMRGVLIVSTYALVPQSQQWTNVWREEAETRRLPFPSTYSQGLYNAVLAQLGHDDKMLDYRSPSFDRKHVIESDQPPLWISTVNEHGRFVPLAYFANETKKNPWGPLADLTYRLPAKVVEADRNRVDPRASAYAPPPLLEIGIAMAVFLAVAVFAVLAIRHAYPDLRDAVFHPYRPMSLRDWYTALIGMGVMLAATPFAIFFHTLVRTGHFDDFLLKWEYIPTGVLVVITIVVGLLAPVLLLFTVTPLLTWTWDRRTEAIVQKLPGWRVLVLALAAFLIGGICLKVFLGVYQQGEYSAREMLFLERGADLFGGSSAVLPCLLIAFGIIGFSIIGLRLLDLRTRFRVMCPYPLDDMVIPPATEPTGLALRRIRNGVETIDRQLWDETSMRRNGLLYVVAMAAGLAFAVPSVLNGHRTWDGRFWDAIFLTGFSVLSAFAAVSAFRFLALWRNVKLILRGIAGVPMVGAFDRLPERTSAMLARFLLVGRRRVSDLAVPYRLLAELRPSTTGDCATAIDDALKLNPAAGGDPDIPGVQASKLSAAARELVRALLPLWSRKNVVEAYGSRPITTDEAPQGPQAIAEQFIAVQAVFFVSQYFTQLRYFAYMGTFTSGCLLLALTGYHFEPEHLVMVSGAGLVAAVVGVVAWGLFQINKNELVSRVTRTTPGRFSLDSAPLVMNAVQLAGPLVVLLLVQFSGRLRSVVEPAMNLFK
jgi:hypothetical protein